MYKFKLQSFIVVILIIGINTAFANIEFDKQRPVGVSDTQWGSLRAAVEETILNPDVRYRGRYSEFGTSVAVSGNWAIVGAPGSSISSPVDPGAVQILKFDGTKWVNAYILLSDDGEIGDFFGSSVAISEDWAVVGAKGANEDEGSVYIFKRRYTNGITIWEQYEKITASNGAPGDNFGNAVSLSSDSSSSGKIVVGAYKSSVNGNDSGEAYVFEYTSPSWAEVDTLSPNDGNTGDRFGTSVSIYEERIIVGAVNDDDNGGDSGSVYIYQKEEINSTWPLIQKLTPNDASSGDYFGASVNISSTTRFIVGARNHDGAGLATGAAYIFEEIMGVWTEMATLKADDGAIGNAFGDSVALSGDVAIIGAPKNTTNALLSGASYVFIYDGVDWNQSQKLFASDGAYNDRFGGKVAITGDTIIVGAPGDDDEDTNAGSIYGYSLAEGMWSNNSKVYEGLNTDRLFFGVDVSLDGDRALIGTSHSNRIVNNTGVAYIYDYINNVWELSATLKADDGVAGDDFGRSVSLLGDRAVIGAPFNELNNTSTNYGAAYVFNLQAGDWVQTEKLFANQLVNSLRFGTHVELGPDRILIASGIDRVYAFDLVGSIWNETLFRQFDEEGQIGYADSISMDGDRILIGAPDSRDEFDVKTGAVYIYDYENGLWSETIKIRANDGGFGDAFGYDVSLSGNRALIGARYSDNNGLNTGSAYIFENNQGAWIQTSKISGSDQLDSDYFGTKVSLSGTRALIGNARNAYVFDLGIEKWSETVILNHPEKDLGSSVNIDENRMLVGSFDGGDYQYSGSVHVYHVDPVYAVGGIISGLNGTVEIQNNGNETLVMSENGQFEFLPSISGSDYDLNIISQPSAPNQECEITNPNGMISGSNVTNVVIECTTTQFQIGLNVIGLAENNMVQFANGDDIINVNTNGVTFFNEYYDHDSVINIITTIQPTTPNQTCTKSTGTFPIVNNQVIIDTFCVTEQYALGVNVTGLKDGSSLSVSNGQQQLDISNNGETVFSNLYDDGSSYFLGVIAQPTKPDQICTISTPIGEVSGGNEIVDVNCTTESYFIGGSIMGLDENSSIDFNINTGQNLINVSSNTFIFTTPLDDYTEYVVSILNQPTQPNQECDITNASGRVDGEDVTDILVNCETLEYLVGLTVSGLITGNTITVQNNNTDNLNITQDGGYVFNTPISDLHQYSVTITSQANNPIQECTLSSATGNISGEDVDNIEINCEDSLELIFKQSFE